MAAADMGHAQSSVDWRASKANAALLQHQWDDYKQRFQPVSENLIAEMGTGVHTKFADANIAAAAKGTDQAFSNEQSSMNRNLSRYGQGLSEAQTASTNNNFQLAKGLASDNATNAARNSDTDMRNDIMSGGLGTVGKAATPM